jgi:hypothetical protein
MRTMTDHTIEQAIDHARTKLAAVEILFARDRTTSLRLRVLQQRRVLRSLQESLLTRDKTVH